MLAVVELSFENADLAFRGKKLEIGPKRGYPANQAKIWLSNNPDLIADLQSASNLPRLPC